MTDNSNHPIEWFENRIGEAIFRAPIYEDEKTRSSVGIKIRNKEHAHELFKLQRPGRPGYVDKKEQVLI